MFRSLWLVAVIVCITVMLGIPALVIAWFHPYAVFKISRLWSRIVLGMAAGVRVEVEGVEHVDPRQSYIFLSNHQSAFDIPALITYLPVQTRFIAKKELGRIPLWGWAVAAMGHVMIDRANIHRARESLDRALAKLKRERLSIVTFPEGTRTLDGAVLPFKKGVFMLALQSQLPVVPVSITGAFEVYPKTRLCFRPGVIRIRVHEPIETRNLRIENRDALMARVREIITADVKK